MLKFLIDGSPLTWKSPFVGSKGAYSVRTPIMQQIKNKLREQMIESNTHILSCPVGIFVIFFRPIPKSTSKRKREAMICGKIKPEGGGDRSNYTKFYEDCLQGCVITNDNLIQDGREAKYYGDPERTEIYVFPIEEFEQKFGTALDWKSTI